MASIPSGNLLHSLLEAGDFSVILDKIFGYLDLESLHNLSKVNRLCNLHVSSILESRTRKLKQSWLSTGDGYTVRQNLNAVEWSLSKLSNPRVVCDDNEVFVVAFDPARGWMVHTYTSVCLTYVSQQCLYAVDKEDFPWSQYIGHVSLSTGYLVITPSTAGHEIHLWKRSPSGLSSSKVVIRQQMADRYSAVLYNNKVAMYRSTQFSLYEMEENENGSGEEEAVKRWSYWVNVQSGRAIKKVVAALDDGLFVWENDLENKHSLHFRGYDNRLRSKKFLLFPPDHKENPRLVNDVILAGVESLSSSMFVIDSTSKNGSGILDVFDYDRGCVVKSFEHAARPQHGWVVHCRSVCPPRNLRLLKLLPFIQYNLCLDLDLLKMVIKDEDKCPWPECVESLAHNTSDIFFTDGENDDGIRVLRSKLK